jgi:hypothetical protein
VPTSKRFRWQMTWAIESKQYLQHEIERQINQDYQAEIHFFYDSTINLLNLKSSEKCFDKPLKHRFCDNNILIFNTNIFFHLSSPLIGATRVKLIKSCSVACHLVFIRYCICIFSSAVIYSSFLCLTCALDEALSQSAFSFCYKKENFWF